MKMVRTCLCVTQLFNMPENRTISKKTTWGATARSILGIFSPCFSKLIWVKPEFFSGVWQGIMCWHTRTLTLSLDLSTYSLALSSGRSRYQCSSLMILFSSSSSCFLVSASRPLCMNWGTSHIIIIIVTKSVLNQSARDSPRKNSFTVAQHPPGKNKNLPSLFLPCGGWSQRRIKN